MKIANETLKTIQRQFDLDCNLKEAEEIESRLKELANTVQEGQESPAYN